MKRWWEPGGGAGDGGSHGESPYQVNKASSCIVPRLYPLLWPRTARSCSSAKVKVYARGPVGVHWSHQQHLWRILWNDENFIGGQRRINIKSYLIYNPAEERRSAGLSCLKKTALTIYFNVRMNKCNDTQMLGDEMFSLSVLQPL